MDNNGEPVWYNGCWYVTDDVDELWTEINMTDGTEIDWDKTEEPPKLYRYKPEGDEE